MAVELLNRIESRLGVIVVSADLMTGPTVARLAAVLAERFGGIAKPVRPNGRHHTNETNEAAAFPSPSENSPANGNNIPELAFPNGDATEGASNGSRGRIRRCFPLL
jgi:hypothetical protein